MTTTSEIEPTACPDTAPAPTAVAASGRALRRAARALASAGPVLVLAAAPFLVFAPVWLAAPADAWHFAGDTTGSYWPDLQLHWHALRQGTFPLWNPYDRAGYPFCADPQTGVLYPVDWALAAVGLLLGALPYALLQLKVLLHLSLAGAAMYTFLRGRALPRTAAVAGGLSWQLGAWLVHNAHFAMAWPAAWFPFALWAVDRLCRRPSWGAGAALGVFGGLLMLAGSPPAAWYAGLVVAPWLGFRLTQELRAARAAGRARAALRALLPPLALAAVVALVLALPILLAAAVLTKHSVLEQRDFAFVASGSLSPVDLPGLFVRSAENLYIYSGVTVLGLALVGLWRGRPRSTVAFFAVIALVGLALALGSNALLLRVAYHTIPGVSLFRLAFRYLFLTSAGLAVLAAYGVAAVGATAGAAADAAGAAGAAPERQVPAAVRAVAWFAGALALFALLGTVFEKAAGSRPIVTDLWYGALLAGVLAAALAQRARGHLPARGFAAALVALLLLDLGTHAWRADLLRKGRFEPGDRLPAEQVEALRAEQARDHSRVYAEFALNWRPGTRHALYDLRGYMDPLRLQRYADVIALLPRHPAVLARFAVRAVLHAPHPYHGLGHNHVKEPARIPGVTRDGPHIFRLADPAPYAAWVGRVRLVDTPAQALATLPDLPADEAVVARADLEAGDASAPALVAPLADAPAAPRVAAVVGARTLNGVTLTVEAPAAGLLVVNEAWFPGWRATVDGAPAPVVRADHLVQAVPLAAGRHQVVLRFRPAYFVAPAWIAAATALGLLLAFALARLRRRPHDVARPRPAAPPTAAAGGPGVPADVRPTALVD
jgi:hypothetical protein